MALIECDINTSSIHSGLCNIIYASITSTDWKWWGWTLAEHCEYWASFSSIEPCIKLHLIALIISFIDFDCTVLLNICNMYIVSIEDRKEGIINVFEDKNQKQTISTNLIYKWTRKSLQTHGMREEFRLMNLFCKMHLDIRFKCSMFMWKKKFIRLPLNCRVETIQTFTQNQIQIKLFWK